MPSFPRMSRRLSSTTSNVSNCSSSGGSSNERPQIIRVVLLGGAGVGKTSILERFLFNTCPLKHKPTLEQLHRAEFEIGENVFTIDLLDTSGTYEFTGMRHLAIDSGDAFVLVYSVDSESSFAEVERFRDEILARRVDDVPIVVVGNKSDKANRVLSRQQIEPLVNIEWEHAFVECSAQTDDNVIKVFTELLAQAEFDVLLSPVARRRRDSMRLQRSAGAAEGSQTGSGSGRGRKGGSSLRRRRSLMTLRNGDSDPDATHVACCVM